MAGVKGKNQFMKFKEGKFLGMKDAILANCYMCNGYEESGEDCRGKGSCALYAFSPYGRKQKLNVNKKKEK